MSWKDDFKKSFDITYDFVNKKAASCRSRLLAYRSFSASKQCKTARPIRAISYGIKKCVT